MLIPNRIATTTVSRVRFRSTMCVPPWDAGVKPSPPKPGVAPRVHQDESDECGAEQHLEDSGNLDHRGREW